jgi:hypothetical protein
MAIDEAFFDPFDELYGTVTELMDARAKGLTDNLERLWLTCLIRRFLRERKKWCSDEYEIYRNACAGLESRLLRLVAGAYLHVSYDLAKVLGRSWPGAGRWRELNDYSAESIYFSLSPDFPESMLLLRNPSKALGFASFVVRFPNACRAASRWVLRLRESAWKHGHVLATRSDTQQIHKHMLAAMSVAIRDVSLLKPWSVAMLDPPHSGVWKSPWPAPAMSLPMTIGLSSIVTVTVAAAAVIGVRYWNRRRDRERDAELAAFIDEWGWRTELYVRTMMESPREFPRVRATTMMESSREANRPHQR